MRVLISGISGYIGQYLVRHRPASVTLSGTYHKQKPAFSADIALLPLELQKPLQKQLEMVQADVCIHTAAMAGLADCQRNEREAMRINAEATAELADWCRQQGIRLIYLSTDIVFDGQNAPYNEDSKPEPVNVYGKSKLAGEQAVQEILKDFAVCRIALSLGRGLGGRRNFIDWLLEQLRQGREVGLFNDEIRTPSPVTPLAERIWQIALSEGCGIYHCFGRTKTDRYALGRAVCRYLQKDEDLLKSVSLNDAAAYPRPADVSLTTVRRDNQPLPAVFDCLDEILTEKDV